MDIGSWVTIAVVVFCSVVLGTTLSSPHPAKKNVRPKKAEGGQDEDGKEFVYVLSNPSYADAVFKIGLTTKDVSKRKAQLYTTGVPLPFDTCMVIETDDCKKLEAELHKKFANKRMNNRREWFKLSSLDVWSIYQDNLANVVHHDMDAIRAALGAAGVAERLVAVPEEG